MSMNSERVRDVIIVGGGAAGLSAGLTLARARRAVTIIDAGAPRNAPAAGVHGLLALDGTPPAELLARGRAEVTGYGGEILAGEVRATGRSGEEIAVTLADGQQLRTRTLLIATGLVDELPDIPGVAQRWGHDVLHCPYCHGWEVRDQAIGVLATGPNSAHQALLFSQWSRTVSLFANGLEIEPADRAKLEAVGVAVIEGSVAELDITDDKLSGVRLGDGSVVAVDAAVVATRMVARVEPFAGLGIEATEHPMGAFIAADEMGQTPVAGVWVAGNATDLAAQVSAAAAEGARAAAHINAMLIMGDADRAVARLSGAGSIA